MVLYNVTVKIDKEIQNDWLSWMKEVHVPKVMSTGLFTDSKIFKLKEPEDLEGHTYTIQYFCESSENLNLYRQKYAADIQADHSRKFKGKYVAFRTVLETVD